MATTFEPSTAYGHVHRYLPGSTDGLLKNRSPIGVIDPTVGSHRVKVRYRTWTKSEQQRFAGAFEAEATVAVWDVWSDGSDPDQCNAGDLLEVDGVDWIVGARSPGRWGNQQTLFTTKAVING